MHGVMALLLAAFAWKFHAQAAIVAAPAAVGPSVIVADTAGDVYALNRSTGAVRWSTVVENGVWSQPLAFGRDVVVNAGDAEFVAFAPPSYAVAGRGPSEMVGINAATGSRRWEFDLAGSGRPAPALVSGILVHHDGSSEAVGIDAKTGAYCWRTYLGSVATSNAAVAAGNGAAATSGAFPNAVFVLRVRDGTLLHRIGFPAAALGFAQAPLAASGARIYGTYLLPQGLPVEHLYAIDAASGRVLWDVAVDRGAGSAPLPQLLVHRGTIYAGSPFHPEIQAFNASTGERLWRVPLHGVSVGGILLHDGMLYTGDKAGWISALDPQTGALLHAFHSGGDLSLSAPAADGNSLLVGAQDGVLQSIPFAVLGPAP